MQLYVSLLLGEEITYYSKKYLNNESRNPSLCKFFMKFWRKSQSGSVLPCDVNGPQSSNVRGWPEADGHLPRPRNGIHLKPKLHLLIIWMALLVLSGYLTHFKIRCTFLLGTSWCLDVWWRKCLCQKTGTSSQPQQLTYNTFTEKQPLGEFWGWGWRNHWKCIYAVNLPPASLENTHNHTQSYINWFSDTENKHTQIFIETYI